MLLKYYSKYNARKMELCIPAPQMEQFNFTRREQMTCLRVLIYLSYVSSNETRILIAYNIRVIKKLYRVEGLISD